MRRKSGSWGLLPPESHHRRPVTRVPTPSNTPGPTGSSKTRVGKTGGPVVGTRTGRDGVLETLVVSETEVRDVCQPKLAGAPLVREEGSLVEGPEPVRKNPPGSPVVLG